ncbi:CubicO group peptidase (beta-lactamase class C family) [Povalibacter uvarum]|uniref:CubicO group peptidase (Beta-lactamase class C family) n=1 Tax=Povalibacter uvarum TaxID=732238 RepID=A0A841HWB5_9GAMM|nr:serine hydrolase domain-containing protein [Povalibacter uvarum]MBB6096198.1 CubicO group peptidase (beta-lactamase class C family) [Povalibacter uvarum]
MHRHVICIVLISGITACATTQPEAKPPEAPQRWTCSGEENARKQQIEHNMLPRVVFEGETTPVRIESRMAAHKTPALSVAVINDGKLDWSSAWGVLGVDSAQAGCDSLFQAGSLAKPVTLLAALRMKEAGLIDFDRNIDSYLVSYDLPAGRQTEGNPVTFRNLFAHTAGITPGGYAGYAQTEALPTDQQIVRAEPPSNSRKVEVLNEPGTSLIYSGGGYTVIEIALQDQLRKPFEQIMSEWLIDPVGMKQATYAQPPPPAIRERIARGHRADGSIVPDGWRNHPEQAAAGLWATANDMAAFLLEIYKAHNGNSKVLSQASIRELLAAPIERHAYGFRLIGEADQVFITHYGGTEGYRAGMTLNLRTGDGAVYLSNSDAGSDLGAEFLAAVSRVYEWTAFREVRVTRVTQPVEVLQSLAGVYTFPRGRDVSVVYEKQLTLVFPNGDRYALEPIKGAPRRFIHPASAVEVTFEGEGLQTRLHLYGQIGTRRP